MRSASANSSNPLRDSLRATLHGLADPARAAAARSYFKTGPGEYGEGDCFLGVTVPQVRKLVKTARALDETAIESLLDSSFHEERLLGVFVLVDRAERGDAATRKAVFDLYLRRLDAVNNWDLVDSSAPLIIGPVIEGKDGLPSKEGRALLDRLARSPRLWDRRVAILTTLYFTRAHHFEPLLTLATLLVNDREDLMHKAVGWMLREAGKKDERVLRGFLRTHAATMPRTALRYAIERLPESERRRWLEVKRIGQ